MHSRRLVPLLSVAALLSPSIALRAHAQEPDISPPAHVAFVDGAATLERDGRLEGSLLNMPLLSGDRIRTTDGRVEILFADASALQIDARSTVDFQSDELLRLIDGRVRLSIAGPPREVAYRIDAASGSVRIVQPGDYRISLLRSDREPQLELAVLRGAGEIFTEQGTTPVQAGERAYASAGLAPSYPYVFNSASGDAFDRWAEMRRYTRVGASAQYLPADVQPYSTVFDTYGQWRNEPRYGTVWYPTVAVDWRPYYYGRWQTLPSYGWTWIGNDPFAWPTHHYGRWGVSSGVWFWIPGRNWGPAWVSWGYAPGYVSWCPLGWDDRAVVQISVNRGVGYSPWNAWTVVSAPNLGAGYVPRRAVLVDNFDVRNRPTFMVRPSAPDYRADSGRQAPPIRWAGRPSVGSSGRDGNDGNSGNYFTNNGRRETAPVGPQLPPARGPRFESPSATSSGSARTGHPHPAATAVPRDPASGAPAPRSPVGGTPAGPTGFRNPSYAPSSPRIPGSDGAPRRDVSPGIPRPMPTPSGDAPARRVAEPIPPGAAVPDRRYYPIAPLGDASPRRVPDRTEPSAPPAYRVMPRQAPDGGYRSMPVPASPPAYQAMPRQTPDGGYGRAPEATPAPAPPAYQAMPRQAPDGGYRRAPENTPAPAPPPRRESAQPSAPPPAPSTAPASPRNGGPATGIAVRRGGGD